MKGGRARVLVPMAIEGAGKGVMERHFARLTYISKLLKHDLIPIFLSPAMPQEMVDELFEEAHGAMFLGGADIDPKYYGEVPHLKTECTPTRDNLEIPLVKRILSAHKPFLGICRGAQVLAVGSGGALHQHLPDLDLDELHSPLEDVSYAHLKGEPRHEVSVERTSKAFQILKREKITTNSSHHQAAKSLGADLVVSGHSRGGIAEIIEHRNKDYFCFGLQSHPEVFGESDLEEFFTSFAKALKE